MAPAAQNGTNRSPKPILLQSELEWPFGELEVSENYLRETAFEILVTCCRTSPGFGARPTLTYIPLSERSDKLSVLSHKSLTFAAASKVKRALGLPSKKVPNKEIRPSSSLSSLKPKKPPTIAEIMRQQLRISEQSDIRLRRALLRILSGQFVKRVESIILPLELLQQLKPSDFYDTREYHAWQKRQLRIIEVGLLLHPSVPLDHSNIAALRLRQTIRGGDEKPIETGKNSETMQALSHAIVNLAWRSNDGALSEMCHWADGFPLNLHLYLVLLRSCFDNTEETTVIDEIDEVMDLMKKTWTILGINQMLHNICFTWVLFQQFFITGQIELDLLGAAESQLVEVGKDAKATKDPLYVKVLNSTLSAILGWAEKRLLAYHDTFRASGIGLMQSVLPVALAAAKILVEDISLEYLCERKEELDIARNRVDMYIRSSVSTAFAKLMDRVNAKSRSLEGQQALPPALLVLATNTKDLARNEKENFSPVLKIWHPFAAGVAAATLHYCYGRELRQFLSGVTMLTLEAVQVLQTADNLEKELVQIAVEDSVDSEDGGKGIIQEMPPYEANSAMSDLSKTWIKERLDRLQECIDRNMQQEIWSPMSIQEQYAPSAVEVLTVIRVALDAFFDLPVFQHSDLLLDLVAGLDRGLQRYISYTKFGRGSKNDYIPPLPPLTRCRKELKFFGLWKRNVIPSNVQRRISRARSLNSLQSGAFDTFSLAQLYVCMNTLYHIQSELVVLEQKISHGFKKSFLDEAGMLGSTPVPTLCALDINFELARASAQEGIQKLCENAVYKVVFHDLSDVLCEGLYRGGVANARIEPVIKKLELNLEIIAHTVHNRMQSIVGAALMKASLEGFLLVLLAAGPSRAFSKGDSVMIEDDFNSLKNLFKAEGVGLPSEIVEMVAMSASKILPLFSTDTQDLIENLRVAVCEANGLSSTKLKLPLPPTSGVWSPTDPNTILRVLCYRNDAAASHFLKKMYRLPKRLSAVQPYFATVL